MKKMSEKKRKHELKIIYPYFQQVWDGFKKFEVRENDRDFRVGDLVILREYQLDTKIYTGREIRVIINYLFNDSRYLKENYVIFSFQQIWKIRKNI